MKETVKQLFPDDPQFIEKIQTFKENLINRSSQFLSFKNNFVSEKRTSLNKKQNDGKETQKSNLVQNLKGNFSLVDTKPIYKSMTMNLNMDMPKDTQHKTKLESDNENRIKFIDKNPISELTQENDLKQTNENITSLKTKCNIIINHPKTSGEIVDHDAKINKNNLQKFNLTKNKFASTTNIIPHLGLSYKTEKNKNYFKVTNPKNQSQMNLSNPKIKIKISNDISEKIKNSNDYLTDKKPNILYSSLNDNVHKNINININNKITNFYNMADLISGFDDKGQTKNNMITENDIQRKLAIYRTKLNSEMLRLLNEEKSKENDRQILHENMRDNVDRLNFEKEVSKERLESSDKIIKMNQ